MKRSKKASAVCCALMLAALLCIGFVPAVKAAYTVSDAYRNSPFFAAVNAVELTGDARTDLVNVARSQLGYIEGGEPGDFGGGGLTGVCDNYTEYIYWYFGDENAHGDDYAWCAAFVSWCADKAGISADTIPKFARVQSEGVAVFQSWDRFRPSTYTPEPGDLIFYVNHVGIVEYTQDDKIVSIEGNYRDQVQKRTNYAGSKSILGYGVLSDEPAPWPAYLEYPGSLQTVGSDGLVVKWLQRVLNDLGFDCGAADGIFGNNTKNAVMRFQTAHGLTSDGIAGQNTWTALWQALHAKYPDAHRFRITVTEPTCTEGGYTSYACMICRYGYAADETEALGHAYGIRITPPTCTEGGITTYKCVRCGDTYMKDPIDPPGHTDADGDGVCDLCSQYIGLEIEPQSNCVCGKAHSGPFAGFLRFFHKIVYYFKNLFGKK
ncbi:MAG: peptidoglycan-binding protein [Clostridia bacterium]|nr:peptidoglycan-binding protein [Clostridia bacterium]